MVCSGEYEQQCCTEYLSVTCRELVLSNRSQAPKKGRRQSVGLSLFGSELTIGSFGRVRQNGHQRLNLLLELEQLARNPLLPTTILAT